MIKRAGFKYFVYSLFVKLMIKQSKFFDKQRKLSQIHQNLALFVLFERFYTICNRVLNVTIMIENKIDIFVNYLLQVRFWLCFFNYLSLLQYLNHLYCYLRNLLSCFWRSSIKFNNICFSYSVGLSFSLSWYLLSCKLISFFMKG